MTRTILPQEQTGSISGALTSCILRGLALYQEKAAEIERVATGVYMVPSATVPGGRYRVEITDDGEHCPCVDHARNGLGACKHTVAALIAWAKETAVRYGIEADLRYDGDERYYVCRYEYAGEIRVRREIVTVTGSAMQAESDVRGLRSGALTP